MRNRLTLQIKIRDPSFTGLPYSILAQISYVHFLSKKLLFGFGLLDQDMQAS